MNVARAYRDVTIAFVGVAAVAAGFIGFTTLWSPIVMLVAVWAASAIVLVDVVACDRPVAFRTKVGGRTADAMGVIAILSAIAAAFLVGTRVEMTPDRYPFLVASPSGTAEFKSAPRGEAGTLGVVSNGDMVQVSCFVDEAGGRWFKVEDGAGWLLGDEVFAEPHTGLGNPPRCPD